MGREEREVILVEREGGSSVKWLLLGAAVGAGLALLFAPKPGKEFRRDVSRRIRGLKELADETLTELKMEIGSEDDDEAPEGESAVKGDEALPVRRAGASPKLAAREELERRLAAARARRRQPEPVDEEPVA